jgi:membrane protein implicated in regulation of membrane protease activity
MKKEVIEKLAALITAAFGLVAALAWNEAIRAMFAGPCGTEGAGSLCALSSGGPWVYAILVTILAVLATIWIGKISDKATKKEKKKEDKKQKTKKK